MIREKVTTLLALLFLGLAWVFLQIGLYFERASDRAEAKNIRWSL